ncbi:MAG: ATP-binding cassette domain-containing protein [Candidatus Aenigmarchaeota archaeon]|nr:ATP-binding cassette domain-containing protein [Candidatus Aenigmarchaeota archaeon]
MKPVVEMRNVIKEYIMGEVRVKAINGVSLKIKKSENIALMGPSGSGKSTMLHLVGCLDRSTRGKIFIDGNNVSNLNDNELAVIRRKKIGFIFQFFNLIPSFTALGNVELPMMFSRTPNREKKAKELLKAVGLEHRSHHYPSQLSGGETQRVAIARALANDPQIVLADEPTGNLDSKAGEEIMEILIKLNKEKGVTLLIVTHDNLIAKHARRKIKLKDGKISSG